MKRSLVLAAALIAAFSLTVQSADARGRRHIAKEVKVAAIVTGAAATVTYFAINDWKWRWQNNSSGLTSLAAYGATTLGCAAVAPMVATVLVKRPLTMREGHVLVGSCVLPIVGGWLVNEAYNAHPEWEGRPVRKHHRRHKKA